MLKCELQQILLERDHQFALSIPKLSIATEGTDAVNKLPLMGKSGAGKSTLLNILAAIEWPDAGTVAWWFPDRPEAIRWNQRGPSAEQVRLLRRKYFGFAFQDSTLLQHLRVCDNLCYPLLFNGYAPKDALTTAWQALDTVLLDDEKCYKAELFRQFPARLSGGQRQRVALIQAMIHNPCVLFADEPTGSLDRVTRQQVMNVLYQWVDDVRHTGERLLLWVTHHENDPRDARVPWILNIANGKHCLTPFQLNQREDDPKDDATIRKCCLGHSSR